MNAIWGRSLIAVSTREKNNLMCLKIMVDCIGLLTRCHQYWLNTSLMMTSGDVCQAEDGFDKLSKQAPHSLVRVDIS